MKSVYLLLSIMLLISIKANADCSGVPANNYKTDLSWGESYYQTHLLMEFERTRDSELLRTFLRRADCVLATRDDNSNRDTRSPTWTAYDIYDESRKISNVGLDGLILFPFGRFLMIYKTEPHLFVDGVASNLNLDNYKIKFENAISAVSGYHQTYSWNRSLGTYKAHSLFFEQDSRGRTLKNFERLPYNLVAAMGSAHFMLYLSNEDPAQLRIAKFIASDILNALEYDSLGAVSWLYFYADKEIPEDLSHGAIVANFIKLLADSGVIFDASHIQALDKAIRYFTLGSSDVIYHYIGKNREVYYRKYECQQNSTKNASDICRSLARWLPVIPYSNWTDLAKEFIPSTNLGNGGFDYLVRSYVSTFTRELDYGNSTCSREGQCTSGSCFGLPQTGQMCGFKLGNYSNCKKDSDCFSGQCFGGQVCGSPLGNGSICTRHHECASGNCDQSVCVP